jgi:hypothetical protein
MTLVIGVLGMLPGTMVGKGKSISGITLGQEVLNSGEERDVSLPR